MPGSSGRETAANASEPYEGTAYEGRQPGSHPEGHRELRGPGGVPAGWAACRLPIQREASLGPGPSDPASTLTPSCLGRVGRCALPYSERPLGQRSREAFHTAPAPPPPCRCLRPSSTRRSPPAPRPALALTLEIHAGPAIAPAVSPGDSDYSSARARSGALSPPRSVATPPQGTPPSRVFALSLPAPLWAPASQSPGSPRGTRPAGCAAANRKRSD